MAALGLVLVALSMRAAIGVVGPVFSAIDDELGLPLVVLAFIGAAPPLGFALAGLVVPEITRRCGLEIALMIALTALILGQAVRAGSSDAFSIVAATYLAMLGIGATNVLLPPLVRRWFPAHIAWATAVYLALLAVSAAVPAWVAVRLAEDFGWRATLAVWIALPALALLAWVLLWRSEASGGERAAAVDEAGALPTRRPVWASPTAWSLVAVLALPSIGIYTAAAILPTILVETAGLTPAEAGAAMGVVYALGIPLAFLVPLSQRFRGITLPLVGVAGVCSFIGWGGLLVAPAGAPFLWAALIGLIAITFPLSLFLVNARSRTAAVTVALSGFVQGSAYVTAGASALLLGLLFDLTGSWNATLLVLAASSAVVVPGIVVLSRERYVDDELQK